MMVPHIEIVTVLTIILFAYPIFVYAMKNRILTGLNFSKITKAFNKAIVSQIVNAIILGISGFILNKMVYANGHGTMVTDIVGGTTMTYLIVGGFFYVPGLIIINIINWILRLTIKHGCIDGIDNSDTV